MAISESQFTSEQELQDWVAAHIQEFLPDSLYIPGFQVTTVAGKHGIPDGFAFNFQDQEWFVIEHELLQHGVWPHIAEQIVRFVVALQNSSTRRKIRDRLFEHLQSTNAIATTAVTLGTTTDRLLQKIELFVEGVTPQVVIFIDDINQDLSDMANALAASTKVFRVQKFIVNGQAEYYSPDRSIPALETEVSDAERAPAAEYDILELLGGGELVASVKKFKCYRISNGSIIHVKKSKLHEPSNYYWYGIAASTREYLEEYSVTHIVFVMGEEGYANVPIEIVTSFLEHTKTSKNPDGSIRHWHCLISPGPDPKLFWSNEAPQYSLAEYYELF